MGSLGKIMFGNTYQNKKVLITGHTGFKGSWLTTWLLNLGADVIGISKDIPTKPSMFEELGLEKRIQHYLTDIRNFDNLSKIINQVKPDFDFHLAAQAIVSASYNDPLETISSNVIGTANVLEALRLSNKPCTAIIITSDKAYDNVEQIWGYKENDRMGGKDIYSGSKGAAEFVIKSYYHSFFKLEKSNVRLATARAGNVIGGGDWAKDRIVVDAMLAWHEGRKIKIRSPNATRPWQHVLEPLSGYLNLGQKLFSDKSFNGECFNFGPRPEQNQTVKELLQDLMEFWNFDKSKNAFTIIDEIPFHEAGLLKLNCEKALTKLKWKASLDYKETIKYTSQWYYEFYKEDKNISDQTIKQIIDYEKTAKNQKLAWTE